MNRWCVGCDIDHFITVVNQLVSYTPLSVADFKDHFSARRVTERARRREIDLLGSRDHSDVGASVPGAP
jgi:hypothetical protein